jgi:hypothetical protein
LENLKGRDHSKTQVKIILKWILGKYGGKMWTVIWLGIGPVADLLEQGNEPSDSVKGG